MSRRRDFACLALAWSLAAALGLPTVLRAEESAPVYQSFSVSTGFDLSTGDYDLPIDTDILYVPFSFTYERGPWLAKIMLPLLGIRGPGDPQNLPGGGLDRPSEESDFGIGDIYLDVSYYWALESEWLPSVEFGARIKIPTASRSKNLGTGEADYILGIDLARRFGDWTPFLGVAYRFLGDNEDFQLADGFATSVGLQYRLHERVNVGAIYDWRQSTNEIQSDPQEISPYLAYRATDHVTITPYAAFGLTSSALDAGVGLTLSYLF